MKLPDPRVSELQKYRPEAMSFLSQGDLPTLASPTSQLCTANQFEEEIYAHWCEKLRETPTYNRKQWEFVYICQVLEQRGMLANGKRGLGFGVGKEPLPALFANSGCDVMATDLDPNAQASADWIGTNQHAAQLSDLNERGICDPVAFSERVRFRAEDMNRISGDLVDFDFTWSACAFEHLGSIKH
jgi:hypothetical protein